MIYSKKLSTFVILSIFLMCGIALAQDESFLKNGSYARKVQIDKPETSVLAETFLRNGISVTTIGTDTFHFKTTDSGDKFTVFIYYIDFSYKNDFVGKFVYKKKRNTEETIEFVNVFVSWMLKNAWSK